MSVAGPIVMSVLPGTAEQVAKTIERALTAHRPRPRYRVTAIARVLPALHVALAGRMFDAFLRTPIKPPGRDAASAQERN